MQRVKLASVLLEVEDYLSHDEEMLYRREGGSLCSFDSGERALSVSGLVDFATYLNGFSAGKWVQYTGIDNVVLHVELAGDAGVLAIRTLGEDEDGTLVSEVVGVLDIESGVEFEAYEVDLPLDATIVGFALMTSGSMRIRDAYYYTVVDEGRMHPTCLALCTTTFRKEEFIVPNIDRIKQGVLQSDDEIARNFHLFVVDNGCTLDAQGLSGDGVSVIPNPNVGGAGGFARGMMAAQEDGRPFTHVILMDDDVRMLPESFKRLYALLSLTTPEYERACVNGAMLQLEHPSVQFEDVSYVRRIGGYQKIKPCLNMHDQENVVRNELIDVEVDNAYGAWWFSCIPMELVREKGLPMPFFIRCDDVEYGVRCQTKYMTMNGISVWHAQFVGRFNAAIVCYQYARNMMITNALHDCCDQRLLMLQFWRTLHVYLRTMDYAAAELWLDGLDDYLKGPEFLMQSNGIAIVKANSAKAEKLVPLEELDKDIIDKLEVNLDWLTGDVDNTPLWRKVILTVPHDRHYFPDFMLSDTPGMLAPGSGDDFTPWYRTAMRKHLVAMSIDGTRGNIRTIDRARYKRIVKRYRELMEKYRDEGPDIAQRYREKRPEMTSAAFWKQYLANQ